MIKKIKLLFKPTKEKYGWFGNYTSWEEALGDSTGYNSANILQKTKDSLLKIKNGEAIYERDSVLFDKKEYPFAVIAALLNISIEKNNNLQVLDFGGSLGSTWFQVKDFLPSNLEIRWTIVEQKNYVDCGKEFFENDQLKFEYSIKECFENNPPFVVIISSSVQYLNDPHKFLKELINYNPDYIIFDRTSFLKNNEPDRLTLQRVHPDIYDASYPSWFFNEPQFLAHFSNYKLIADFEPAVEAERSILIDGKPIAYDKGFFFKGN